MARGAQDPGSRIHLDFGWWIRLQRTGPGDPDMGHERRMQRAVDDGQREWRNASGLDLCVKPLVVAAEALEVGPVARLAAAAGTRTERDLDRTDWCARHGLFRQNRHRAWAGIQHQFTDGHYPSSIKFRAPNSHS
jgi:hypothetical protein